MFFFVFQLVAAWEKTKEDHWSILKGRHHHLSATSKLRNREKSEDCSFGRRGARRGVFPVQILALLKGRPRERTRGRGETRGLFSSVSVPSVSPEIACFSALPHRRARSPEWKPAVERGVEQNAAAGKQVLLTVCLLNGSPLNSTASKCKRRRLRSYRIATFHPVARLKLRLYSAGTVGRNPCEIMAARK